MHINVSLIFWASIGSICLSSKQIVSVIVDSYESTQELNVHHGKSLLGLIRLITQLYNILTGLKSINLYEEIIVWICVEP